MKMLFLLYFFMGLNEAVEAFEADVFEDTAITAYHNSEYAQAL
jgi:hypothetical protein